LLAQSKRWTYADIPNYNGLFRIPRAAAGDAFRAHADKYLRSWLSKGAPSLFTMVRKLYANPAKGAVLQALLDGYLVSLRGKPSRFASDGT